MYRPGCFDVSQSNCQRRHAYGCAGSRNCASAQVWPLSLRTGIADALGIPESELRVVAPEVGGGSGQKMPLIPEYVVTVWAARHFAGPVAWIEDRLENLTASFHARDQRVCQTPRVLTNLEAWIRRRLRSYLWR